MGLLKEFKEFALRGNVVDMAVGIIIGGAFGRIVASIVADVIMPPIGMLLGGTDFTDKVILLKDAIVENGEVVEPEVALRWGQFVQITIDFIIVAFAIFIVIKVMNAMNRKEQDAPPPPAPPSQEEILLTEIRDLLKSRA